MDGAQPVLDLRSLNDIVQRCGGLRPGRTLDEFLATIDIAAVHWGFERVRLSDPSEGAAKQANTG
jgi:hypothetical protein